MLSKIRIELWLFDRKKKKKKKMSSDRAEKFTATLKYDHVIFIYFFLKDKNKK